MLDKFDEGIGRVLKPDGETAGTGFVVTDDGLVATCALLPQLVGAGGVNRLSLIRCPADLP